MGKKAQDVAVEALGVGTVAAFGVAVLCVFGLMAVSYFVGHLNGQRYGYAQGLSVSQVWEKRARECEARPADEGDDPDRRTPPPMPDFRNRLPPAQVLDKRTGRVRKTETTALTLAPVETVPCRITGPPPATACSGCER